MIQVGVIFSFFSFFLACTLLVMYLLCCWDQNSVTSHQNPKTISQTWQITVNLSTNTGSLKVYNKPPTLVVFHMIKCLGKEFSHSSSYCAISSLPSSLPKLLAKARGSKVLLGTSLCYPSLPSPSHLNFSSSGLASYSCSSELLHHFQNHRRTKWIFLATDVVGLHVPL